MASRTSLVLLFLASTAGLVGCAPESTEEATEGSEAALTTREEVGIDAQVLQVWTAGRVFPTASHGWTSPGPSDVNLDSANPRVCPTLRTWTSGATKRSESREVDCTRALGEAAPFDDGSVGPVMTPVRFTVTTRGEGSVYADPDFCSRIELRVVVRNAALADRSFSGVGFWSSRGETFTPRSELELVGQVRLASGDEARVFRFVGISTCVSSAHGSTSGNLYQTFAFKPYAAYDRPVNGSVTRYRVWENLGGNHLIGKSWPGAQPQVDAVAFDRQSDLLSH